MHFKKYIPLACLAILLCTQSIAQLKQVTITLDDVPFTAWSEKTSLKTIEQANHKILQAIERHKAPVTIFINEGPLIREGETEARIATLKQWLINPLITAGNHSYSHLNYTSITPAEFKDEIIKGEVITKKLLEGSSKTLLYFRFPFNALGKDSITKAEMQSFLTARGYINTPFTIESLDYLFNTLYQQALDGNDKAKAQRIAQAYIDYTLSSFDYFENLSIQLYGRKVPQIFLGHMNALHADHLDTLLEQLKKKGYTFSDLTTALADKVYQQTDYYAGPYGFSWFFRWEKDAEKRKGLLRQQPDAPNEYYQEYLKAIRKAPAN